MKNKNSPKPKGVMFILVITIVFGQYLITEIIAHPSGGAKNQQQTSAVEALGNVNDPRICQNQQSLCLTEECVVSAGQIIESMDLKTDPCDDFYQFSCGGWMRKNSVPKTEDQKINQFESIDDQITRDVQDILERPSPTDSKEINMTRAIYESCLDAETVERVSAKSLLHVLLNSYGGWPILTPNWNENGFDWKNVSASISAQLGLDLFFGVKTRYDPANKEQNIITLSPVQPAMEMMGPLEIEELMSTFRQQLTNDDDESSEPLLNPLNGLPVQINISEKDYEDIRFFQFSLKLIYLKSLRLQNSQLLLLMFDGQENLDVLESSFIKTLSSLQNSTSGAKKTGKIQWKSYIQSIFSKVNITITSNEQILVPDVSFLTNLLLLLDKTPNRVIANYFHWKLVQDSMEGIKKVGKKIADLLKIIGNSVPVDELRKAICAADVRQLMQPAISAEYIKRFYHSNSKNEVTEIVHNLKEVFRSSLPNMGMDATTKLKTLEKLAAMKEIIGYPGWITNTTLMEAYYQGLNVNKATYFENIRSINKVLLINDLKSLRQKRRNDEEWKKSYLYDQTAEYRPRSNAIAFSLGVLQSPVFKTGRLMAVNYGSFGVSVGHEIAHGLFGTGRKYNVDGEKEDWWSEETTNRFEKMSQCFVNQYNNYSVLELDKSGKMKVNGTLTLEENISDLMGVSQAFKAYRSHVTLKGPEPRLPGLKQFSPEQLFFVSFANKFCVNYSKEGLNKTLVSDDHSPGRYRIIGALSNSEDFSQHFKCSVGSRMNPSIKCKVLD